MDRKELIKKLEEKFNVKASYLGVPTCNFEIMIHGVSYVIYKDSKIVSSDGNEVDFEKLLSGELNRDDNVLELSLGERTGKSLKNFFNIIYSKQELIKKAFDLPEDIIKEDFIIKLNENKKIETIDEFKEFFINESKELVPGIDINFEEGKMLFKFCDKTKYCATLITRINNFSRKVKRASYKQAQTDNPKFAMRTWLIRLGFSGDMYKDFRRRVLCNLDGNSAFRYQGSLLG